MKFAICEKRKNMSFHASGTFVESSSLEEFMELPETQRTIRLNQQFGDTWKIVRYVDDDTLPNEVVHIGTSERNPD